VPNLEICFRSFPAGNPAMMGGAILRKTYAP
jgi:hypothetical protein